MGRPIKYSNHADRQKAISESKTRYMLKTPWYCEFCYPTHNYSLAGKWSHCKSKKHITNYIMKSLEKDDKFDVITVEDQI